ncbi:NAD(P)/FAD-dependent oxidoreductase [Acidianus sulfidivorans JP7]|uniref:Dehydrogenase n=1 Tax=Acidianus sulfidivorans JP7 TaxID=619593 RepID=A0A2U9IP43_9CREN|nr:NAD(P)/FAD-dependent oxidoreductase [Acidianus sulfidivorans]AWR97757.1 NAD(P)/FAD-dependent oxidoreductase [Acidianus sulfidivorans JP7]
MNNIAVLGGGVSGSLLSYLLHAHGYNVTLYDIKDKYFKPCGDIVPRIYESPVKWNVRYYIKNFAFYIDGERIYDVRYRSTKWLTIDKSEWINSMRSNINQVIGNVKPKKDDFDVIIDAKGPYDMDREVVYTSRALIKVNNFDDEAILEFNSKYTGFYWIFPDREGIYNIGAGFLENKNSRELLLKYIKEKYRDYEILDLRGAPISIGEVKNKDFKIGEARGLVFPMSGEGIRPSAISAEIAFEAIYKEKDLNEYLATKLHKIESRINIQRKLLEIYTKLSPSLRKYALRSFFKSEILIDAFLEDKLDLEGIRESIEVIKNGNAIY